MPVSLCDSTREETRVQTVCEVNSAIALVRDIRPFCYHIPPCFRACGSLLVPVTTATRLVLCALLSSASGNGGSEAVATLARTNRTLRGPLRAPSASLSEPAFGRQQGGYNLPTREIFFTHTSKEQVLTRVGSCAVSSAAKVNPDWQVTVFSNGLTNPKQKLGTRQQWAGSFALFPSWIGHNPRRVVRFEYERIFRDTV